MPAALSTRSRQAASTPKKTSQPPAKKAKLSQQLNGAKANGLEDVLSTSGEAKRLKASLANGVKDTKKARLDESRLAVQAGGTTGADVDMADAPKEVVEISSDDPDDDEDGEDDDIRDENDGQTAIALNVEQPILNGAGDSDGDAGAVSAEPSFGEMLQAMAPEPIDVDEAFADQAAGTRAVTTTLDKRTLSIPTATSLGTVLTQALRTNDRELLESCFQLNELDSVRSTIERLPSPLVADLLQRLAERIHKRPGRAGNLMLWVQWSLVAHGGYLSGRKEVMGKLKNLHAVIRARASGLQPLLTLKGKLDMLSAQLELRRKMHRTANSLDDFEEDAMIYVEGDEDETTDEEDQYRLKRKETSLPSRKRVRPHDIGDDESSGDEDDMPTAVNDLESEEDSEDEEGLLDDEASETDNDSGDDLEDEEDSEEDDVDDGEDVSGSEEELSNRRSTASRSTFSRK